MQQFFLNDNLPNNWYEYKDANGNNFYWNSLSNRFQKEYPDSDTYYDYFLNNSSDAGKILTENKGDNIPVANCRCEKGIGKDRFQFLAKVDNIGNIYIEKGKNLSSINPIFSNTQTITSSNKDNCYNNCIMDNIELPDLNQTCYYFTNNIVSRHLYNEQNKRGAKENELIIESTNVIWGNLDCEGIKNKLKEIFNKIIPYKNCESFLKINTIKIYGHQLKTSQLGIIPFIFNIFDNIKIIILEMDPIVTSIPDENRKCINIDSNINIKFSGNLLIASRN